LPVHHNQIGGFQRHFVQTAGCNQKMFIIQANGNISVVGPDHALAGDNAHHPDNFVSGFLFIAEFHRVYFETSIIPIQLEESGSMQAAKLLAYPHFFYVLKIKYHPYKGPKAAQAR
jgi:hypothetical protein